MQAVVAQAGLVVMIVAVQDGSADFLGTGFVCTPHGHIVTCAHILNLTAKLNICPAQPIDSFSPITTTQVQSSSVKVLHLDAENDVALLKPDASISAHLAPNFIGRGEDVRVGEEVGCLGFPFSDRGLHTLKLSATIVCGKSTTASGSKRLHLDANMHQGNSGGPVILRRTGQVVGIVAGRFSPVGSGGGIMIGNMPLGADSTISFAIPIEYAFPLLRQEGAFV
jgi:serine protease Do